MVASAPGRAEPISGRPHEETSGTAGEALRRVFLVEDDATVAMGLEALLEDLGFAVCGHTKSGEDALIRIPQVRPDIVLMDIHLGYKRLTGIDVANGLRRLLDVPVVFLTADADIELARRAAGTGTCAYLTKPVQADALRTNLETTLVRHESAKRLRESEARFRALFEQMAVGVAQYDPASDRLIKANRMLGELTGYTSDELRLLCPTDLFEPAEWGELVGLSPFGSGKMARELRFFRKDGTAGWCSLSTSSMWTSEAPRHDLIIVMQDITERRRAEQALRESRLLLAQSHRVARIGSWQTKVGGDAVTWTDELHELLGLTPGDLQPRLEPLLERIEAEDRAAARAWLHASASGHDLGPIDAQVRHRDGSIRILRMRSQAITARDGSLVAVVGTAQDVTETMERAEREARLLEHRDQLELIIESTQLGFWDWNPSTDEAWYSPRWAKMLGYEPADLDPTLDACRVRVHPDDREACEAAMQAHLDGKTPRFEVSHRLRHADGRWITVLNRGKVVERDEQGRAIRFFGTHTDITAAKEAERLAIEANQAKTRFLANMSHELRTPLNAVLGLSEALLERVYGDLTDKQARSLRTIHDSGRHLLDLINDVLDIARVEAGRLSVEPRVLEVRPVLQECIELVRDGIEAAGQRLELRLGPEVEKVHADPRRLKQIMVNLLSNATKFSPGGARITVGGRGLREAERLELWVANTGTEIAETDRERIFEPFVSIDERLDRKHGGAGLGLALVKYLVEQHDGNVRVESGDDEVRFVVSLPWSREPRAGSPSTWRTLPQIGPREDEAAELETPRRHVLLVEDNEANVMTMRSYLEAHGLVVDVARDGLTAVTAATQAGIDVVLMDVQLPRLDGLSAIRRIRSTEIGRSLPIIALTAFAMPGDEQRCLEAGATTYMAKPVALRELAATIERLAAARDEHAQARQDPRGR